MSPYKIEMSLVDYAEDKEPLYKVIIYNKEGEQIASTNNMPKEKAIEAIMNYCCYRPIKV